MAPLGCKCPRFQHLIRFDFCDCSIGRNKLLCTSLGFGSDIDYPPPKKKSVFCNWLYKNWLCDVWQNHCLLGQLIFQYYILFRFILWIRHTIHRFRFTGLKIFMPLNNIQLYLQNLVIPSMTRLDTLVNGALIVHWPLAGKIHGEHWLRNRHGWERRSILVLF